METISEQEHPPHCTTIDSDQTRNWCDLPKKALHLIVENLGTDTHLTVLRGVCPAWRSSLPMSDFPRFSFFSIGFPPLKPNLPQLCLVITRTYLLSPLGGCDTGSRWLARLGRLGINTWQLFSPLRLEKYFSPSPPVSGSVNVLDCQVSMLAYGYTLMNAPDQWIISKKVVGGHLIFDDSSHHFVVLAKLEREENDIELVLFNLEDPQLSQWVPIPEANTLCILDIANHKSKFYVFDLLGWRTGLIDPANPLGAMNFIPAPGILGDPMNLKFTVTIDGQLYIFRSAWLISDERLYLVVEVAWQFDPEKVTLIVFVLTHNSWEQVNTIGDRIFFIGYDVSFSLPSSSTNLPQWKPSSVCLFSTPWPLSNDGYTGEGFEHLESITFPNYWRHFRIFNLEEEETGVMVPFAKLPKRVYTGLFFPPPAWVKWRCPSLDNVEVRLDALKFHDEDGHLFSD